MSELGLAITSIDMVMSIIHDAVVEGRKERRRIQMTGIREAKKKGIKFGRPKKELPPTFYEEVEQWQNGETTLAESAETCGMPVSTFYAKAKAELSKREAGTQDDE